MAQVGWQERATKSRNGLSLGAPLGPESLILDGLRMILSETRDILDNPRLPLPRGSNLKSSWIPSKTTGDNPSPASSRLSSLEQVT